MATNKNTLIGVGVLVLGASVALLFSGKSDKPDPRSEQPLLAAAAAPSVDRIEVKKDPTVTTLLRDSSGVWHLDSATGFPADAAKIARFVDELERAKPKVLASGTQEDLGLTTPVRLVLSAAGKDVLNLRLGKQRTGGGRFFTFGDEAKPFLASQMLAASPDADQWEVRTLLKIPAEQIKSVVFTPPAGKQAATLSREQKADPLKLQGLSEGQKEGAAVKSVAGSFANLSFIKRYDPSNEEVKAALATPSRATLTLFDATSYELEVGSVGEKAKKWFLALRGAKLDPALAGQVYEVQAYVAQALDKGLEDLLEAQPKG